MSVVFNQRDADLITRRNEGATFKQLGEEFGIPLSRAYAIVKKIEWREARRGVNVNSKREYRSAKGLKHRDPIHIESKSNEIGALKADLFLAHEMIQRQNDTIAGLLELVLRK